MSLTGDRARGPSPTPSSASERTGISADAASTATRASAVPSMPAGPVHIDPVILKGLNDKLYDRRKTAALELERVVKEAAAQGNGAGIHTVIGVLRDEYIESLNSNSRKGGLTGLAAVAIGISQWEMEKYLPDIVAPILKLFGDQDSRVRYYSCEALYNVAKVSRSRIIPHFNNIFAGLCKLSADVDTQVKSGIQLLDRLLKDVVAESTGFEVEGFIPTLQEKVKVPNANVRQFIVGWIGTLHMVPDFDLIDYLPEFLDGLFMMLSDSNNDVRVNAENTLSEFLAELMGSTDSTHDFNRMTKTLVVHAASSDQLTRQTSLNWLDEFISAEKAADQLLPMTSDLVKVVLPSLAHMASAMREAALQVERKLMAAVLSATIEIPYKEVAESLNGLLGDNFNTTRLAAVTWLYSLLKEKRELLMAHIEQMVPGLLTALTDTSEDVVVMSLKVLALISTKQENFMSVLEALLKFISEDSTLFENRGVLIIEKLSVSLGPERVFTSLAKLLADRGLEDDGDLEFVSLMVQMLNLILLTSTELTELRMAIRRSFQSGGAGNLEVFKTLHKTWSHNIAATLALCLMAEAYELAHALVQQIAVMESTVGMLMQIDQIVRMMESPIFGHLRLHLMSPDIYPELVQCLYGVLMLLPQGPADCCSFSTLQNRLSCVPTICMVKLLEKDLPKNKGKDKGSDTLKQLMAHFESVQMIHEAKRLKDQSAKREK